MTNEQRRRLNNHIQWLELPPSVDAAIVVAQDIKALISEVDDKDRFAQKEKEEYANRLKKVFEKNPHYYNVEQIVEVLEAVK